ncbi:protein-disulfide reductase DsbD domain-containing protein [Polluticaenibacter yanchengensis]|uniref:Protein-disulfide reductase DsbD family protein n=1 Tax=Polluticaenibacter yanchengensis TaxID=3014562 RepID=A0ABT4UIH0_9BACT|nr:protein-disulfide reductase DsbD family protein [Chitinophagaceae bacterium LY-5]
MKKLLTFLAFALFALVSNAQIKQPVKWEFKSKKINDKTYEVYLNATIDKGWHIYTMDHSADIGIATSIAFNKNPLATIGEKPKIVGKTVLTNDPSTGEKVKFHEGTFSAVYTITLKSAVKTNLTGTVEFMACDDKQCLPPKELKFSVAL